MVLYYFWLVLRLDALAYLYSLIFKKRDEDYEFIP